MVMIMEIIVCVDDNMGMIFNKRRQSRDQAVVLDILNCVDKVWIHPFSHKLFEGNEERVIVDEAFLQKAGEREHCFVENESMQPYLHKIEKIILPELNLERNIIVIKKVKNTPKQYPRKPGTPQKSPIR